MWGIAKPLIHPKHPSVQTNSSSPWISQVKNRPYMRYVCGAQKEDISGYAMLHKVRRDRCSLVIYHTRISLSQLLFEPSPNFCELLLSIEGRWIMKRDLSCSDAHSPLSLFTPLCTALHGGSEWIKPTQNKFTSIDKSSSQKFGEGSKSS